MTSKLKCPVCPYCDKPLHCDGTQYINEHIVEMWYCQNPECEETEDLIGTRETWEIVAKVTQAKQDLKIARQALEEIANADNDDVYDSWCATAMRGNASIALEQIDHKE